MDAKFKKTVFLLISFGYKYVNTESHLSFLTQVNKLKKKNPNLVCPINTP